jgi:general secretion pathway protein L
LSRAQVTLIPGLPRFFGWWRRELLSLIPRVESAGRSGRGAWIVVSRGRDETEILDENNGNRRTVSVHPENGDPAAIASMVASLKEDRRFRRHRLAIRLPHELCFSRTLEIPEAAEHDAVRILDLDLARNLPFQQQDIAVAQYRLRGGDGDGNSVFEQLIIKRAFIAPLQEALAAEGLAIDRVDCWDAAGKRALPINFIESSGEKVGSRSSGRLARWLVVLSLLLGATAVAVHAYRYNSAIEDVRAQSAAARANALGAKAEAASLDSVRRTSETLFGLRASEVRRLDALRVLSEILPDSDYLTELRIEDDQLSVSGYSAAAARLVPLLEKSQKFIGVRLTAPVTFDSRAGKERFSLSARLHHSGRGAASRSTQVDGPSVAGKRNL